MCCVYLPGYDSQDNGFTFINYCRNIRERFFIKYFTFRFTQWIKVLKFRI